MIARKHIFHQGVLHDTAGRVDGDVHLPRLPLHLRVRRCIQLDKGRQKGDTFLLTPKSLH